MAKLITSKLVQKERKKKSLFFGKMKDNVFRASMFVAIAMAIVFIAALIIFIYQVGAMTFTNPEYGSVPGAT